MKKFILPLVAGYVSVAALAGIVVVPLYFKILKTCARAL